MEISSLIEPLFENFENPIVSMLAVSTVETIYMVFLSTVFSLLLGFPIGVLLVITKEGGIYEMKKFNEYLGFTRDDIEIAEFERKLWEDGKLEEFKKVRKDMVSFSIELEKNVPEIEQKIIFDEFHFNRGDISENLIRSTNSRVKYKEHNFEIGPIFILALLVKANLSFSKIIFGLISGLSL